MKTLADLGRLYRKQYPRDYPDLSDEEIGRAVKRNFAPAYDDFVDTAIQQRQSKSLNVSESRNDLENVTKLIDSVAGHYNPNFGWLVAKFKKWQGQSRVDLLEVQNKEHRLLVERAGILAQAVLEGKKKESDLKLFIAQNADAIYKIQVEASLIEEASQQGMRVDNYQQVKQEKEFSKIRTAEAERMAEIDIHKHLKLKEIDLDSRWKEIVQDLDAGDLLMLSERQLISKLRYSLEQLKRQRYELLLGNDAEYLKRELLADKDAEIEVLEELINAKETRLILSENGHKAPELTE